MSPQSFFPRVRWAFSLTLSVLLALLVTLPLQAAGLPAATGSGAAPASGYPLLGDTSNNGGQGVTYFHTNSGSTDGGWVFTDAAPGGTALSAACSSLNCLGFWSVGTATGVYGQASNTGGIGVYGSVNSSGIGVLGTAYGNHSTGVAGEGLGYGGVFTDTLGTGIGVSGNSPNGQGVYGSSTGGTGVYGRSTTSYGMYGKSDNNYGIVGVSANFAAVRAIGTSNYGIYANTGTGTGIYALTSSGPAALWAKTATKTPGHYSIIGDGDVLITGTLHASGGIVAPVSTTQGPRLVYAEGAATNVVSDRGTATLKAGRAIIAIDPLYAQTVNLSTGYQVFAMPNSAETLGLAVVNKTATSFEIRELGGGKGNFRFDWRIEAPRKGYEQARLAPAPPVPAAPPAEPAPAVK